MFVKAPYAVVHCINFKKLCELIFLWKFPQVDKQTRNNQILFLFILKLIVYVLVDFLF